MSSLVAPPVSSPSLSPGAGCADLEEVRAVLAKRGWDVAFVSVCLCGEVDQRLRVGRLGVPAVELLGPCEEAAEAGRWQAVRVAADRRVVWSGPVRPCPAEDVAGFVEDLLGRGVAELAGRWTRLG